MEDLDDPFGFHEDEDNHETADQPTVEEKDPQDDAAHEAPEKPRKSKPGAKPPAEKAAGSRDYGRTGIASPDPVKMAELTKLLKGGIKNLGTYEVMTCLANACEQYGEELANHPNTSHRAYVFNHTATVVDKVVNKLKGG